MVADYPSRGGKRVRPMLCLVACRLYGGHTLDALPAATALELFHSAFLVHDDIEDGSLMRRGRPTLHRAHGVAQAINAGDALSALAMVALARGARAWPARVTEAVTNEFAHLLQRTTEGQATELAWIAEGRHDLSDNDYLGMIRDKTCWYSTIQPLRIGGIIGSAGRSDVDVLNDLGFHLGTLFQIHDDLENLEPGEGYEKDAFGDLVEGKRTLPVLHMLRNVSSQERSIALALLDPTGSRPVDERVAGLRRLLDQYRSLDHARELAAVTAGLARAELDRLFGVRPASPEVTYIDDLIAGLTHR
jgi:geranylgeranyl diphosphate synthase type II